MALFAQALRTSGQHREIFPQQEKGNQPLSNRVRLSPEMIARCEAWAREVVAHYGGDDLHAMPWSRHMMVSDDLRQWLASREEAGRMIDIETCEIGCWYANANGDPYGIRDMLGEETHLEKGYTDKFSWVRSPESRGWVNEGDLPPAKARAMYDRIHREAVRR
jgi:hypothetical protein